MADASDKKTDYYRVIMDAIVTQELAPSQKVSENILSDMFGISRTAARNLIERLVAQQFLISPSPRITQVAPLTLLDIRQNFTLRKIIMPEVIPMAGSNIDFELIKELDSEIRQSAPIDSDDKALSLLKANKQLNMALIEPLGYPLMKEWINQLEDITMRIYWIYIKTKKAFPYASNQQSSVLSMLESDEPSKVKQFITDIISQTEERVLNVIFSNEQFYKQDLTV